MDIEIEKTRSGKRWNFAALIISLAAVALVAIAVVWASGSGDDGISLTFLSGQSDGLFVTEKRLPSASQSSNLPRAALEMLFVGPKKDGLSPFPSNLELLSMRVSSFTAYIDLSGEYGRLSPYAMSLADYCIAHTLSGLDGILEIMITVDGQPHPLHGRFALLPSSYISDSASLGERTAQGEVFILDPSGGVLKRTTADLRLSNGVSLEEAILNLLIYGDHDAGIPPSLPSGTRLLGISVRSGSAYVNLSGSFEYYSVEGMEREAMLALYSVVNSLTSLPNVTEVYLRIYGEAGVYAGLNLSKPLTRNLSYLLP